MQTIPSLFSQEQSINIKAAKKVFRAIDHPLRKMILDFIASKGKTCVTDIYVYLRIEQSVASQHLAILRHVGIVIVTRDGKNRFYEINEPRRVFITEQAKILVEKK